jgi:hypothetical protein
MVASARVFVIAVVGFAMGCAARQGTPEVPAEAEPEISGPCAAYAACCTDYAHTLGSVEGMPPATIEATLSSCDAIKDLASLPDAQDACAKSLDALKRGLQAYTAMPGFEIPESCR